MDKEYILCSFVKSSFIKMLKYTRDDRRISETDLFKDILMNILEKNKKLKKPDLTLISDLECIDVKELDINYYYMTQREINVVRHETFSIFLRLFDNIDSRHFKCYLQCIPIIFSDYPEKNKEGMTTEILALDHYFCVHEPEFATFGIVGPIIKVEEYEKELGQANKDLMQESIKDYDAKEFNNFLLNMIIATSSVFNGKSEKEQNCLCAFVKILSLHIVDSSVSKFIDAFSATDCIYLYELIFGMFLKDSSKCRKLIYYLTKYNNNFETIIINSIPVKERRELSKYVKKMFKKGIKYYENINPSGGHALKLKLMKRLTYYDSYIGKDKNVLFDALNGKNVSYGNILNILEDIDVDFFSSYLRFIPVLFSKMAHIYERDTSEKMLNNDYIINIKDRVLIEKPELGASGKIILLEYLRGMSSLHTFAAYLGLTGKILKSISGNINFTKTHEYFTGNGRSNNAEDIPEELCINLHPLLKFLLGKN